MELLEATHCETLFLTVGYSGTVLSIGDRLAAHVYSHMQQTTRMREHVGNHQRIASEMRHDKTLVIGH